MQLFLTRSTRLFFQRVKEMSPPKRRCEQPKSLEVGFRVLGKVEPKVSIKFQKKERMSSQNGWKLMFYHCFLTIPSPSGAYKRLCFNLSMEKTDVRSNEFIMQLGLIGIGSMSFLSSWNFFRCDICCPSGQGEALL